MKVKEVFKDKKTKENVIIGLILSVIFIVTIYCLFFMGEKKDNKVEKMVEVVSDEKQKYNSKLESLTKKNEKIRVGSIENVIIEETENTDEALVNLRKSLGNSSLSDVTDDPDIELLMQTEERLKSGALKNNKPNNNETISRTTTVRANSTSVSNKQTNTNSSNTKTTKKDDNSKIEIKNEDHIEEEPRSKNNSRFFTGKRAEETGNTFSCSVHGEQEVVNGSTLKLRLLEAYTTQTGRVIPRGATLWAVCNISRERMFLTIENVIQGKDLIPISVDVYDIDGLKGIDLPNSVKAEIASKTKEQGINDLESKEIIGNGNILQRGANTVVGTAKSVLSKKESEIKVTVKSNHRLILKPKKA
ncbi:MAG: hypothetical protein RL662_2181 [Bacteroidota bacterium]|jgi:hypothetical protein